MGTTRVKIQLPVTLDRQIAVLDAYVGKSGSAHVFQGRIHNAPGLIGELMVAGESDPGFFGLPIRFTIGQRLEEPEEAQLVRTKAESLWQECRDQARTNPSRAAELREHYLRGIDSRLIENPVVRVKVYGKKGADRAENDALRKLNHRGIIRRYACVEDPRIGTCLFTEAFRAKSLEYIWARRGEKRLGALPLAVVAHLGCQLAQALTHAHHHRVVHGDLRPANMFVEEPSDDEVRKGKPRGIVKIGAFGVQETPTMESLVYLSPEQMEGCVPTFQSDVYQLGVSLWVLATGRLPYEPTSRDELKMKLLSTDPHPNRVHHFRGEVSAKLEAVIEGAREKDVKKRWPLAQVLEEMTQLYASKHFTLDDGPRSSIAEELLARAQTNVALRDFYRAIETLDLAADFFNGVEGERAGDVKKRHEALVKQIQPYRPVVEALKKIHRQHIAPVDNLMEQLYERYGDGKPILRDEDKGVMREADGNVVIERRSVIDYILQHTSAAIQELGKIDGEMVGDMHRKMVDRASSQEEACSDLVARMVKFGEDYIRKGG
jgi:serine/threonine protein kinase